jgi:nitrogen fixation protein FixH
MSLTALLYGAGRYLRLSNFWASVLACGLPSLMYVLLVVVNWPGLDVVTLHLVAYPTVAVLLYQLYGAKASHASSMHWAPKLMIGFFLVITVLYGGMIYIAGQGLPPALARILLPNTQGKNLHTGFAGVVAHKQEDAAKGIGQHLRNEHLLRELGWKVEVAGLNELRPGAEGSVTVRVVDQKDQGVDGIQVAFALARPGDKPGPMTQLNPIGPGLFHAMVTPSQSGTWVLFTTLTRSSQTVSLEHTLEIH